MLTPREMATVVIIGATITIVFGMPKSRAHMAPLLQEVVRAAFAPRLAWLYVVVVLVAASSTTVAWAIGMWDLNLLKDAVILTLTVVLPMTCRSFSFRSGGELAHKLVRDTFALTALLTVYLDAAPLPLCWEIVFQLAVIFLAVLRAFAATKPEYAPAKRPCDILLLIVAVFLLVWTTVSLVLTPPEWSNFFQSLLFGFWLPLTLLPFFYMVGFYALTEKTFSRFRAIKKPLSRRASLAVMVGTRLRLGLLARFDGRYNYVGDATGFRDGLRRMSNFRNDLTRRDTDEANRLRELTENIGASGVDNSGRHLDRREFDVTKKRLDWIWTCQNGQYERQGERYWDHLTDLIVDADNHGLPTQHGFVVETADEGQAFRAWRRTPGGAVLAVGGRKRRSKFYYQGENPPTSWPEAGTDGWRDAVQEEWPPDWNHDDGTRI